MTDAEAHLWEEALSELAERRRVSRGMGGDERLAKHRGLGKLDARAPGVRRRCGRDQ